MKFTDRVVIRLWYIYIWKSKYYFVHTYTFIYIYIMAIGSLLRILPPVHIWLYVKHCFIDRDEKERIWILLLGIHFFCLDELQRMCAKILPLNSTCLQWILFSTFFSEFNPLMEKVTCKLFMMFNIEDCMLPIDYLKTIDDLRFNQNINNIYKYICNIIIYVYIWQAEYVSWVLQEIKNIVNDVMVSYLRYEVNVSRYGDCNHSRNI